MFRKILTFTLPVLVLSGALSFSGCGDSDDGATDTTQTASGNGGSGGSSAGSSGSSGQSGEAGSSQSGGAGQGGSSGAAQGGESGSSGQAGQGGSGAGAGGTNAGSGGSAGASGEGQGGSGAGAAGEGGSGGTDAGGNGGAGGDVHDGPFVAWKEKPTEPYTIKGNIALDWGFFYDVQLKGKPEADFQIELERCQKPAGMPESCNLGGKQQAKEGGGAVKYGVDPSQYNTGENTYRMILRLHEKDTVVSLDELKLVVIAEP